MSLYELWNELTHSIAFDQKFRKSQSHKPTESMLWFCKKLKKYYLDFDET